MTIELIMDRVFAINGQVAVNNQLGNPVAIKTTRTYPAKIDASTLPLITAVPGPSTYNTQYGNADDYTLVSETMSVDIIVQTTDFFADANKGIAQLLAERLMDSVRRTYWARPRLELDGGDPLDCLTQNARLASRPNFVPVSTNVLEIVFVLTVTFEDKIARI